MVNSPVTAVDDVLITSELATRPARAPDFEAENRAFVELATVMADTPAKVLERLTEVALKLCRAGSAGVSILEPGPENVFRWRATAGEFTRYRGGTMPRNASPCGTVLDRNCALLMADPGRFFSGPEPQSPVRELLLVPFHRDGMAVGTVWVVSHTEDRKFDAEDLRVLTSLTLTRQLLAFARKEVSAPKILDLSAVAGDTAGMLRRLIGENIGLMTNLRPGVWPVLADPGQVEQVLLNFAVNARDAMPDGGTLTVSARNETVASDAEMAPGQYAVLSVTDTGTGMPPEVLERIFEPFFTTKGVGKGTGLGLATVYGIVQQAGGYVRVRSRVGEGSTFDVFLPRAKDPKADSGGTSGIRKIPRGTETVLVVEDEAAVRGLVKMVLAGCGYTVLVAADGVAAERVAAEHTGPIHLVLTDVVMPGAGGRAAAADVLAMHPEAKVVFMSGYTDDAVMRQGVSAADVPFLQKPFTPDTLAAKVRQALDSPR